MTPKERSAFKQRIKKATKAELQPLLNHYSNPSPDLTQASKDEFEEKVRIINAHLSKK